MKPSKYFLVTLEWSNGFISHSVCRGNRVDGEKKNIESLTNVKSSSFTEIEQHEYEGFWTGDFRPQGLSSGSKRTSKVPKAPKGPQFSSLETFFNNTEVSNERTKRTRRNRK